MVKVLAHEHVCVNLQPFIRSIGYACVFFEVALSCSCLQAVELAATAGATPQPSPQPCPPHPPPPPPLPLHPGDSAVAATTAVGVFVGNAPFLHSISCMRNCSFHFSAQPLHLFVCLYTVHVLQWILLCSSAVFFAYACVRACVSF